MPWTEPVDLTKMALPGRRTFVESALGWVDGCWCDGPLAHVLPDGRIASYVPAGGQANPMIYEQNGRQYLVIMAGGHHFMETPRGDYVIAYALPT